MTLDQARVLQFLRPLAEGTTLAQLLRIIDRPEKAARLTLGIMARVGQIKRQGQLDGRTLWVPGADDPLYGEGVATRGWAGESVRKAGHPFGRWLPPEPDSVLAPASLRPMGSEPAR